MVEGAIDAIGNANAPKRVRIAAVGERPSDVGGNAIINHAFEVGRTAAPADRGAHTLQSDRQDAQPLGVVAAVEQYAADAGAAILRAGGNAADAAVAAAFVQAVVDPVRCGIGGGMSGLFYQASTGATETICSVGRAPALAYANMFTPVARWGTLFSVEGATNLLGHQASIVPGFIRGMEAALIRHGSGLISWREAIQPALRFAREGFEVYPDLYATWMPAGNSNDFDLGGFRTITFSDASRRIYTHPDGGVFEIGEVLVQLDYARTLEHIADDGANVFYEGDIAERIAADFAAHGGYLSLEDLRSFKAEVLNPQRSTYREHDVLSETAPSVGPTFLEILNIVECWDLRRLGWNTPDYLDRLARAMYLGFRDRSTYMGDPEVSAVPLDRLLSKDYAAALHEQIELGQDDLPESGYRSDKSHSDTTHVTVVDRRGNAAAITHSVGSASGVVTPGLGFLHNNHMIQFDPTPGSPGSIGPSKRPNMGGAPVFVFRGTDLVLAMGSPAGGRKATAMVQVLANVIDFGMSIQEAVNVDRIHAGDKARTVSIEPRFDPRIAVALARLGHRIVVETYGARVEAVSRDPATGRLQGGSDPRGDRGLAVAYPPPA